MRNEPNIKKSFSQVLFTRKAAEFAVNHERKPLLCNSQGQIRSSVAQWMDYDANISKG